MLKLHLSLEIDIFSIFQEELYQDYMMYCTEDGLERVGFKSNEFNQDSKFLCLT